MDGSGRQNQRTERHRTEQKIEDALATAIEFLISQGHSFTEIRKYSLPQIVLFMKLANKRLMPATQNTTERKNQPDKVFRSYKEAMIQRKMS